MSRPDGYLLPGAATADLVMTEVARGFHVTVDDMVGDSRQRVIVTARACAMAVIREATDLSFPDIGRLFERDHTTVMHHVGRVMADPVLSESVRLVVAELDPPPRLFAVEDVP